MNAFLELASSILIWVAWVVFTVVFITLTLWVAVHICIDEYEHAKKNKAIHDSMKGDKNASQ